MAYEGDHILLFQINAGRKLVEKVVFTINNLNMINLIKKNIKIIHDMNYLRHKL